MGINKFCPVFIKIGKIVFLASLFFSCSGTAEKEIKKQEKIMPEVQTVKKVPSSYSDTLTVNTASAVFYIPDSVQLEKFKLITTKNVYESTTHENFFQMRNARIEMKKYWPKLRIIETTKVRYLRFVKADKSLKCVDLDTQNDLYGIILFNGKKDPLLIDMMNIDTELEYYFNK